MDWPQLAALSVAVGAGAIVFLRRRRGSVVHRAVSAVLAATLAYFGAIVVLTVLTGLAWLTAP
ncbi:hypothetical protein [Saccharopolyspora sp. CA-218241]|uniref:hypothetical protein n=1 Tax=Saccharopolyspora sp. CA-218241 TaxID=3240027 RepID=UPI003D95F742